MVGDDVDVVAALDQGFRHFADGSWRPVVGREGASGQHGDPQRAGGMWPCRLAWLLISDDSQPATEKHGQLPAPGASLRTRGWVPGRRLEAAHVCGTAEMIDFHRLAIH